PYYDGTGRSALSELPKLVANPRATLPFGGDTLRFYIEAYGLTPGTRVAVSAVDARGTPLWQDTLALGAGEAPHAAAALPPGRCRGRPRTRPWTIISGACRSPINGSRRARIRDGSPTAAKCSSASGSPTRSSTSAGT